MEEGDRQGTGKKVRWKSNKDVICTHARNVSIIVYYKNVLIKINKNLKMNP